MEGNNSNILEYTNLKRINKLSQNQLDVFHLHRNELLSWWCHAVFSWSLASSWQFYK